MHTQETNELLGLIPDLSLAQLRQVLDFVRSLLKRPDEGPLDTSDRWSEEDMQDVALAALRYADETLPYREVGDPGESGPPASRHDPG
jgi:hypothetical protein